MTTRTRPADRLQPTGTGETLTSGDTRNDSTAAESRLIPYAVRVRLMTDVELEREADRLTARIRDCHATNDRDGEDVAWRALWGIREGLAARRDAPLIAGFRAIEARHFLEPKRPSLRDAVRRRYESVTTRSPFPETLPGGGVRLLLSALPSDDDGGGR